MQSYMPLSYYYPLTIKALIYLTIGIVSKLQGKLQSYFCASSLYYIIIAPMQSS